MFRRHSRMLLLFLSSLLVGSSVSAAPSHQVTIDVRTSPASEMKTQLVIMNNETFNRITDQGIRRAASAIPVSDTHISIQSEKGKAATYLMDDEGNLYDEQSREIIELKKKAREKLLKAAESVRYAHYGKLVEWEEAKQWIPKSIKFKVIDMETGLSFRVQRRAGKHHADVQPLTKEDTAVMKRIYNGSWSWQRKAILVDTGEQRLAASMHGMPHGGDGIPNNNFSGHFCIHFLGSSTHGSGRIDPEHQLMVRKAAGQIHEYLDQASPYEIVSTFLLALNLKETQVLRMSFTHAEHPQLDFFLKGIYPYEAVRSRSNLVTKETGQSLEVSIPVEVGIARKGRHEEKMTFTFIMKRTSLKDPWKIDSLELMS